MQKAQIYSVDESNDIMYITFTAIRYILNSIEFYLVYKCQFRFFTLNKYVEKNYKKRISLISKIMKKTSIQKNIHFFLDLINYLIRQLDSRRTEKPLHH